MKYATRTQFVQRSIDLAIGTLAFALLLTGCFAHKADVSEAPAGSTTITAGPTAPSEPPVQLASLKAMTSLPGSTSFSIDILNQHGAKDIVIASHPPTATLAANVPTKIAGWAVDTAGHRPAGTVFVTVDGNAVTACAITKARPDVATALGSPDFTVSGWECSIPARALPAGKHALGLKIAVQGGHGFYTVPWPTELIVQ